MSKTPDKPGWWWFEDGFGILTAYHILEDDYDGLIIHGLGELTSFDRDGHWLGPCYKPGESFTVGEIVRCFTAKTPYVGLKHISDKKHGIKAFTERTNK